MVEWWSFFSQSRRCRSKWSRFHWRHMRENKLYHKRNILTHAQWLEFCLKWTATWCCPTSCKVADHLVYLFILFFLVFHPETRAPLCIVETMLGHQYLNADKSQQLVNYVEDYLECVESLPLDIQRNVSLLREIDAKYQGIVFPPFFCHRLQLCVTFFHINYSQTGCVKWWSRHESCVPFYRNRAALV